MNNNRLIKIKFTDWYPNFNYKNELTYKILNKIYNIAVIEDDVTQPEYLIDGGLGDEHIKYDCIKIIKIGENIVPDFNLFDYAIGFDPIQFSDRYIRIPLFASYSSFESLSRMCTSKSVSLPPPPNQLLNRKFCSMVVSNGSGDPLRTIFFHKLCQYKQVDSGGGYLNNIGGRVADKICFCKNYKFNIAFENSQSLGYTTEKVMEPLVAASVPIYYGNPSVVEDFNPKSFILVRNEADIDRAIEEIVYLDNNDNEYLKKIYAPPLLNRNDYYSYATKLENFLKHIVEQPIEKAKRLNCYGHQVYYRQHLFTMLKSEKKIHQIKSILRHFVSFLKV